MDQPSTLVGKSGDVAVHITHGEHGDPRFVIEQIELGEIIDLPDLATAREVYHLLGRAILEAEIDLHLASRGHRGI